MLWNRRAGKRRNGKTVCQKEEKNVIEVKDLVKRYGKHVAVDHLSFRVKKGQIYGFLCYR